MEYKINNNLPDFIIVGAAKSGTTALAKLLEGHKDIYIPKMKECRFFSGMSPNFNGPGDDYVNNNITKNLTEYLNLFKRNEDKFCGDASPEYLFYYEKTIENIKKIYTRKQPKIIIILRNPKDRAFSMYMHLIRDLREMKSFEDALNSEDERKEKNWEWVWQYKECGMYYKQVNAFLKAFEKEDIKVILHEDFQRATLKTIHDVLNFLKLDSNYFPDTSVRYNESGLPKNSFLQKIITNRSFIKEFLTKYISDNLKQKIKSNNVKKSNMLQKDEKYLKAYFEEDIKKLEKLISRDLTNWYK